MNKIKSVIIALCIFLLMFSAYGCKKDNKFPAGMMNNNDSDFELSLVSSSFDYENAFTSRDTSAEYDENIYNIQLEDNKILCDNQKCVIDKNVITITNTGTYVIKGELSDGQIIVDADSTDKIQLVLNNVSINNNSSSAIKIVQAKKVFVTLAEKAVIYYPHQMNLQKQKLIKRMV